MNERVRIDRSRPGIVNGKDRSGRLLGRRPAKNIMELVFFGPRRRLPGLGSDRYTALAMTRARTARRSDDAPHVERAYRNLKAAIVEGRYRPGASLSEVGLASEHGMSRTPIREGLARLWQEGYVDRVVGHGYFVARVTVQQIH